MMIPLFEKYLTKQRLFRVIFAMMIIVILEAYREDSYIETYGNSFEKLLIIIGILILVEVFGFLFEKIFSGNLVHLQMTGRREISVGGIFIAALSIIIGLAGIVGDDDSFYKYFFLLIGMLLLINTFVINQVYIEFRTKTIILVNSDKKNSNSIDEMKYVNDKLLILSKKKDYEIEFLDFSSFDQDDFTEFLREYASKF